LFFECRLSWRGFFVAIEDQNFTIIAKPKCRPAQIAGQPRADRLAGSATAEQSRKPRPTSPSRTTKLLKEFDAPAIKDAARRSRAAVVETLLVAGAHHRPRPHWLWRIPWRPLRARTV
jgi:hypothetical protein